MINKAKPKYFSLITYVTFRDGVGAIEVYHNYEYNTSTHILSLRDYIQKRTWKEIIISNVITYLNK